MCYTEKFLLCAVETCGYMGRESVRFVNRLGDIALENGHIPKGAFVRWATQLLSVTVQMWGDGADVEC